MDLDESLEPLARGYNERAQNMWSIYVSEADQHDTNTTETWKANLDGNLIFAGLFSSVITAFIIESYKLLEQNSGDVTNSLLSQILALQLAVAESPNGADNSVPTSIHPVHFVPSASAVVVNILWFLSLSCGLAAAFCVLLLQQWIRAYLQRVKKNAHPLRRSRVRAFLLIGAVKWKMDLLAEYIPTLLHLSLFLFFAGLWVFLYTISPIVAGAITAVIVCCVTFYCLATLAPIFDPSAPYETPSSSIIWWLLQRFKSRISYHYGVASDHLTTAREQLALNPLKANDALERDAHSLLWAYRRITDDQDLETFAGSISGFLQSWDGVQAWRIAVKQLTLLRMLEDRIILLLIRTQTIDSARSRIRKCLEGLYAMTHQVPYHPMFFDLEGKLNYYLCSFNFRNNSYNSTTAICITTLLIRRNVFNLIPDIQIPKDFRELSDKADMAFKEANSNREMLQENLRKASTVHKDRESFQSWLLSYIDSSKATSANIASWAQVARRCLEPLGFFTRELPFAFYHSLLRKDRCAVQYHGVLPQDTEATLEVYSHLVLAFMRMTKVLPSLPDPSLQTMTHSQPISSSLSDTWFPFKQPVSHYVGEQEYVVRELKPISSLLDILQPKAVPDQVTVEQEPAWPLLRATPLNYTQRSLWPIMAPQGPFSTFAFMLDDMKHGGRVLSLISLVVAFKRYDYGALDSNIVTQTLDIIWPEFHETLSEGSQILFISVLDDILAWRYRINARKSCPFSRPDINRLVDSLKSNLTHESSVQAAEQILGISRTNDGNDEVSLAERAHTAYERVLAKRSSGYSDSWQCRALGIL